uniref:Uncharacterized protein n=1 Tax=Knipowitschia caucasica TaxID=637954 RepID=A0AAV2J6V5_KNICA
MNLFCFSLEGSMDSLYEAVQNSEDPPRPVPSRASSRPCSRSVSRSGSPALLLDDNKKWRGSGKSISMDLNQTSTNTNKKKRRTHISKSASDNEALDSPSCNNAAVWQPARSQEDLSHIPHLHHQNEEMKGIKHRTENKGGKGTHHSGPKKKEKPPLSQGNGHDSKNNIKRGQKSGKKPVAKSVKDGAKKPPHSRGKSPAGVMSPLAGNYLDVQYRCDRRPYMDKCSTLPTPDNYAPGRGMEKVSLPGGATPTHAHRWSNPGEGSPLWGSVPHTCHRPLTEYHTLQQDFTVKDWDGGQQSAGPPPDSSLKQNMKPQAPAKVSRSTSNVELSQPNVRHSS